MKYISMPKLERLNVWLVRRAFLPFFHHVYRDSDNKPSLLLNVLSREKTTMIFIPFVTNTNGLPLLRGVTI